MKRAFTLIELMITVAVVGISTITLGNTIVTLRRGSADLALQERAKQVVEYEADQLMHGQPVDPATRKMLLAELPEAELDVRPPEGGVVSMEVRWKGAGGRRETLALSVLARKP